MSTDKDIFAGKSEAEILAICQSLGIDTERVDRVFIKRPESKEFEAMYMHRAAYASGRMVLILTETEDRRSQAFCVVTVHLPEHELEPGEFHVKTWSENKTVTSSLLEYNSELFEDTGKRVEVGFVKASVWRLKDSRPKQQPNPDTTPFNQMPLEYRAKAFLEALANVCEMFNLSIAHEDFQGGFLIEPWSEHNAKWLADASINGTEFETYEKARRAEQDASNEPAGPF